MVPHAYLQHAAFGLDGLKPHTVTGPFMRCLSAPSVDGANPGSPDVGLKSFVYPACLLSRDCVFQLTPKSGTHLFSKS